MFDLYDVHSDNMFYHINQSSYTVYILNCYMNCCKVQPRKVSEESPITSEYIIIVCLVFQVLWSYQTMLGTFT